MNQEKVWDILAESWNNFRQKIYEKELYELDWNDNGKILDVGCGNCRNLKPFSHLQMYGIDFSKEMIKQSKKFAKKHKLNINLKKADMRKIPFKDNFFDYCLCFNAIHLVNKKEASKALKEIHRVLKKDGKCLISVWNRYGILSFFLTKKEQRIPWRKKDKTYYRNYYFYNYLEFRNLLKKNKFKIIRNGEFFNKNIKFLIQK